jgi:hypothetical protein
MALATTAAVRRHLIGAAAVLVVGVVFRRPTLAPVAPVAPGTVARPAATQPFRRWTPVTLEPRWLDACGYETLVELDDALGGHVEPWQPFAYARDASGRLAIASEPYRLGGAEPAWTFGADRDGGIWHVATELPAAPGHGNWTRRIWLVPLDASFRGDVSSR